MRCLMVTGTREAAFVHAISSAGVVYAVTRACSSGHLDLCGCDRSVTTRAPAPPTAAQRRRARSDDRPTSASNTGGFEWSGCSDNIAYGVAFARTFVDAGEKLGRNRSARSDRSVVNLHNNHAGRKVSVLNLEPSGRFVIQEQWERWRAKRKLVSGSKHPGALLRRSGI